MDILTASVGILVLAVALLYIGVRLRIPSIVVLLLIGVLIGPSVFGFISDESAISTFADIGILLLLFTIGLEFSFQQLLRSWRTVLIGGLVQVCMTILAISGVARVFGMPLNEAVIFGFIVSLSSTAIVMKILQEKGEVDTLQGRTLLGILIFQDLAIIPMMLISPLLIGSAGPDLNALPAGIAKVVLIILVIVVLAHWVIPAFLFRVAKEKSRELSLVTLAAICLAITWLTNEAGLSFTLGAFLAGLIIGESDYNIDALGHIIPFRDVFASIFFLSIGMLLNLSTVESSLEYITLIVALIIGIKILTGTLSATILGMPERVSVFCGLALCQIGEFSFVLAKYGLDASLIPKEVYQVFLAGAIITMALTPFFMSASPKVVDVLYRIIPRRNVNRVGSGSSIEERSAPEMKDHIVIAGYGLTGKSVARAAKIAGIPYMVIELSPEVIRQEKSTFRPNFIYGDAIQEEVLESAGIRRARTLIVAISEEEAIPRVIHTARQMAPDLYIIARSRRVRYAEPLLKLGANEVISEEFTAAIEIFSRTLQKYRMPEKEIEKIIARMKNLGTSLFVRDPEAGLPQRAGTIFSGLHVHTFPVEPGSAAEGSTISGLNLKNRFGISEIGIRGKGVTVSPLSDMTVLKAGDVLIFFISDKTAEEILPLFSNKPR